MPCQHPGQILLHQYLEPHKLSQNRLARAIGVPPRRINEIILAKRSITADTAVRLAHYFGNSASYWMQLQAEYDIEQARDKIHIQLATISPPVTVPNAAKTTKTATESPPDKPVRNTSHNTGRNARRRIMR